MTDRIRKVQITRTKINEFAHNEIQDETLLTVCKKNNA